jgi:Ser-tRNA(Ala) deacylase AlaX
VKGPNDQSGFYEDSYQAEGVMSIRMPRVLGFDYQPCAGTHFGNTAGSGRSRFETLRSRASKIDVSVAYWRTNGFT